MLAEHNKENNSQSKDINLLALVFPPKMNFWCHVCISSKSSFKVSTTISSLYWCGKSKVNNLEIELQIEHDILWLEISVRHTLLMAVVYALNHLLEVIS